MPLYFAYGSNMDRAAMTAHCPRSRPVGIAQLARHRFVIMREGFASVVRDPGRSVHGVLWDLALADIGGLDRYENMAQGLYAKLYLSVVGPSGPRRALIYVGRNSGPGRAAASYMEPILTAAAAFRLPQGYVAELQRHLPPGREPIAKPRAAASAYRLRERRPP
ncbi:MAG: gamma-glutamylcyclotransferase [Methylobacteriaceae bacterium]|nr:gamma-glutamylcyclotransferase [Methylobacteriaceae bacterium]